MAKRKFCLENIKLDSITLVDSSCVLIGNPPPHGKGLIKVSVNTVLAVDEGEEDKLQDFGVVVIAKLEGHNTPEEEKGSSEREVFKASCTFQAAYSVIKGTEKKEELDKIVPYLVPQLNYVVKDHLDYLIARMGLSGSLVPIVLHKMS